MNKAVTRMMIAQADLPVSEPHRRWLLARHPVGAVTTDDFRYVDDILPMPMPGQYLVRILYLSIDPKQRLLMNATPRNVQQVPLWGVMYGTAVGEVLVSNHPAYAPGDIVSDLYGWQSHALADGKGHYVNNPRGTRKINPAHGPISTSIGILGAGGLTAYFAVLRELQPRAGETMLVSSAAGNVGSVAGQIGKILGCRVIGLTSTDEKCRAAIEDFGFDACINYRTATDLAAAIRREAPRGIDLYVDNVGGPITEAAIQALGASARITTIGVTARYTDVVDGKPWVWQVRQAPNQFNVHDHYPEWDAGVAQLAAWIGEGRLRYREDIVEGLENAPAALIDLLQGGNIGKRIVRVAPNPPGIS